MIFFGKLAPTIPGSCAGNKKAPDLFRWGFGSDDAAELLRAHDSESPRGLFGFRRGFEGRHHWRGTIGAGGARVNGFWAA
jgi:hypothetical protein